LYFYCCQQWLRRHGTIYNAGGRHGVVTMLASTTPGRRRARALALAHRAAHPLAASCPPPAAARAGIFIWRTVA
jgi:hypothetical protein